MGRGERAVPGDSDGELPLRLCGRRREKNCSLGQTNEWNEWADADDSWPEGLDVGILNLVRATSNGAVQEQVARIRGFR